MRQKLLIKRNTRTDKNTFPWQQAVNKACTDNKTPTFNKANMTYDLISGHSFPQSCRDMELRCEGEICQMHNSNPSCDRDMKIHTQYSKEEKPGLLQKLKVAREKPSKEREDYKQSLLQRAQERIIPFVPEFSESEKSYIDMLFNSMIEYKTTIVYDKMTRSIGGGNCEELTRRAMMEIINYSLKFQSPVHLTRIGLAGEVYTHTFLLVSDEPVDLKVITNGVMQVQGRENVKGVLKRLREHFGKAKICDPWNRLYDKNKSLFTLDSAPENAFYTAKGNWKEIEIHSLFIDPAEIDKRIQHPKARAFMNEELKKLRIR